MGTSLLIDPRALWPFLVFCSFVLLLVATLLSRGSSRGAKWFLASYLALGALAVAAGAGSFIPSIVGERSRLILARIASCAALVWPAAFYLLTAAFLRWPGPRLVWWGPSVVWLAISAIISGPLIASGRPTGALGWATISNSLPAIGWVAFIVLSLILSVYTLRRTPRPRRRNRISYWFLTLALLTLMTGLYLWPGSVAERGGDIIAVLSACLMAYAVLKSGVADLGRLGRQGLGFLAITLVTIAIYLATNAIVQAVFSRMSVAYSRIIGVSAAALALAVLYQPLRNLVQGAVDRMLFGVGYDYVAALRDYSQNINSITDVEELAIKSVTLISHAFGLRRGALLVIEEGENEGARFLLRVIPGMGVIDAFPTEMSWDHPLIKYLQETGAPLTQRDIDRLPEFKAIPPPDQDWLQLLDMAVYVPIKTAERLLGILALGPKGSGNPYYRSDLDLLATLGDQTVLALRNAQHFAEISTLNVGIVQLNDELRRLDEAKTSFLTIASHELKTPLTLIQGYANILAALPPAELQNQGKVAHITEGIARGTERLRRIIDDMLDVSRIDANMMILQWKECRLSHILRLAAEQIRPAAEERKQTLKVQDFEDLPSFDGDPQRLHQAFRNLIENAVKFTPDGGTISVSARLLGGDAPEEQFLEVVVADTGIGVAPEDQERIFEKFYRVGDASLHSSSKVQFKGGGPGLGLAISKGIIEAHGGKIWVASEGYDEETYPGSEFHVLLMVKAPDFQKLAKEYAAAK